MKKKSEIGFNAHNYLSLTAVPFGKTYADYFDGDAEPPQYTIDWDEDPGKFAESLRKGADFLDQFKEGHNITVRID